MADEGDQGMKIELTELQTKVVIEALDHYSRIGQGQLENLGLLLAKYFDGVDADGLNKDYVYPLKRAVFCHPCHSGNGSWNIASTNVPEIGRAHV